MKPIACCALVVAAAAVAPRAAHADLFSARADLHVGGSGGAGLGGAQKDNAYFGDAPHGAYGALVGVQALIADAYIDHTQYTDGSRVTTWTQFALGVRVDVKTGAPPKEKGAVEEPKPTGYFELGVHAAFGLGTGQQVSPPLDNAQITDKAFLLELRGGFGKILGNGFRIGLTIPVSGGYFFKSGNGATANDTGTHYTGLEAAALLTFGLQLGAW
jgi:hypothetical protein